ncbi:MAG: MFS transporter [Verrucomicrobiota bacterium]|nr:MFS transporter [Verrucomicrobiota bacterium]
MNYLFVFFFFNFVSCMIVMDSPIILYAESLGASATVIGLIAGITPLMVIFQIPAADHVGRFGYKRSITVGWTLRLVFVLPLVAVPLLDGHINPQSQLALIIGALFCFNLIRGIASTAWFPWITGIIPERVRGRYLTRESAANNIGSFFALMLAAMYLGKDAVPHQFAGLFAFSLVTGLVSLWFIHRVPDAPVAEEDAQSKQPVKWSEIIRHQPFRKLLWVCFIWAIFMGGLLGFIVKFLKTGEGALADDRVLYASAAKFVGGLITLWFLYSRLDRLGSRPLMFLALGILGLVMAMWIGMSGGKIPVRFDWVCGVYFVMGFGFCTFYMSLTKLAMATVPELGKSHFFALYSVVGSLAVGIFPILWGILIDSLTSVKVNWLGLEWNQFSIYFTALLVVLVATAVQVLRVEEKKAARLNELVFDLLRNNPLREWMRR